MSKIELTCTQCGSTFERESRENNRSQKIGRRIFCSRKCSGKANISNIPIDKRSDYDISKHANNKHDEFTGFRNLLTRSKKRNHECTLTLQELKQLWEISNHCVYSGVELKLPKTKGVNSQIYTASVDRIDSLKGYTIDNIQYVSIAINHMKNNMTHEETIELCKTIANKWKPLI